MVSDPQINEVLVAIERFSRKVDDRFDMVDARFVLADDRMNDVHGRCSAITKELSALGAQVATMRTVVATKDYLDDRLSDLRTDMLTHVRREDRKLDSLLGVLRHRNVISDGEHLQIMAMGPFPQS